LQLPGGGDHQVWRDPTWSTQGEILSTRRSFPQPQDSSQTGSGGILR